MTVETLGLGVTFLSVFAFFLGVATLVASLSESERTTSSRFDVGLDLGFGRGDEWATEARSVMVCRDRQVSTWLFTSSFVAVGLNLCYDRTEKEVS